MSEEGGDSSRARAQKASASSRTAGEAEAAAGESEPRAAEGPVKAWAERRRRARCAEATDAAGAAGRWGAVGMAGSGGAGARPARWRSCGGARRREAEGAVEGRTAAGVLAGEGARVVRSMALLGRGRGPETATSAPTWTASGRASSSGTASGAGSVEEKAEAAA